jgi:hypothetical protein
MSSLQPLKSVSNSPSSVGGARTPSAGLLLWSLLSAGFQLYDNLFQFTHDRLPTFVRRTCFPIAVFFERPDI